MAILLTEFAIYQVDAWLGLWLETGNNKLKNSTIQLSRQLAQIRWVVSAADTDATRGHKIRIPG